MSYVGRWARRASALVLVGSTFMVGPVLAQQPSGSDGDTEDGAAAELDSLELVFEREVFNYPLFDRRNPFRPLSADEASGPRFEDMVYLGSILSSDPAQSIALIGARVPGATSGQPTARTYRLRLNDTIGNVRVLDIRTDAVLVEVQDFGVTETRTLSRRAEPPPPAVQSEEPDEPAEPDEEPTDAPPDAIDSAGVSGPAGQARTDDVDENRRAGGLLAANAENGNGGWS